MKLFLKTFFKKNKNSDFSEFFVNAKSADKKKLILRAVKKANEDQKQLLGRYQSRVI